jgi:hypothetical protein
MAEISVFVVLGIVCAWYYIDTKSVVLDEPAPPFYFGDGSCPLNSSGWHLFTKRSDHRSDLYTYVCKHCGEVQIATPADYFF